MATADIRDLNVTYEGVDRQVRALDAVSLTLAEGEPVAVIGPSGCGKSTLLLALAGLVRPTSGAVTIDGVSVTGPRRRTALILQEYGLLPWKTVLSNVRLGLQIRHVGSEEASIRVRGALARVGLTEFAAEYPSQLSGGMRQRVALARALALDADLMLMDEPLSALDALTREDLQDLLLQLWLQRRHTSVLVTHSIEEAAYLGRRIVVLTKRPGRISAVVDNPGMGADGYRDTEEFYERCARLRRILSDEGALHAGAAADGGAA